MDLQVTTPPCASIARRHLPPAPKARPVDSDPASKPRAPGRVGRWLGRYSIVADTLLVMVGLFTLERVALAVVHVQRGSVSVGQLAGLFAVGLRFDLIVCLVLLLPQIVRMTLQSDRASDGRAGRWLTHLWTVLVIALAAGACGVEFAFFDEFQSRLNYLAFEYLIYPTEVFTNIWQSYPVVPVVLTLVGVVGGAYLLLRQRIKRLLVVPVPPGRRVGILAGTLAAIVVLWATTGMASLRVSSNRVANECAGNGLYSLLHYAWTSRFDYEDFYPTVELGEAYGRVRERIGEPSDVFHAESSNPLDRTITSLRPRRDSNVVLILEESFGADFVGVLGDDRELTPRFDALSKQGILFDNFYATGNRTARALEATLASLPPIPTESILKRDHSDRVYTLPRVLGERDYERLFITGGRGAFDGMRSFMMANGFERFVEQRDFSKPTFVTAWGVCDEDIFGRALEEFDAFEERGKPFFATVLTISNHQPYTFPEGRVDRASGRRSSVVKYADWALGELFDRARSRPFYEKTMFIVMGDHGARVYGAQLFPVQSYRIPVLMILPGGERQGTRASTLASSLDIAPTIMGVLGGSYRSVFFGRDALHIKPSSGYAVMQHNRDLALLENDDRMTVLGCSKAVSSFRLDRTSMALSAEREADPNLQADAVSFYQAADQLYYDENYFPASNGPISELRAKPR